jgi:hypothetical protein
VVARAVFTRESTGVIPLPALNATTSPWPGPRRNTPAGRVASTVSPSLSWSFIQFDTTPPGVRFTVTFSSGSTAGEDDME